MIPRVYAVTLLLFPPAFRAAFGECMIADFADGLRDVQRATRRSQRLGWFVRVAWDLARSIGWQWLRTSVPWLTTAYAAAILIVCEGLSAIMVRSRLFVTGDGMATTALWHPAGSALIVFVVSALIFTLWFILPNLRRETPVSIRA